MKKLINFRHINVIGVAISALLTLQACQSAPNYKAERQKVMDLHDKVMGDSEEAVSNRMVLDTIVAIKMPALLLAKPSLDTIAEKAKVSDMIKKLNDADELMMDWMNEFEPDVESKSPEQALKYFQQEFVKIKALDDQFKSVIAASDAYISQTGLQKEHKDNSHQGHNH